MYNIFCSHSIGQLNCAAEIERRLKDSYDLIRDSDDRAIEYLEQHDSMFSPQDLLLWLTLIRG